MAELRMPHQTWTNAGPVVHTVSDEEIAVLEERTQATMGEPGALALFGFATGTWMAGVVAAGWLQVTAFALLAPVLILFAGLAQFIGGLFAFRKGNTFAGTAFCSYGTNNAILGSIFWLQGAHAFPLHGTGGLIVAYELLSFGLISAILTVAALSLNATFVAILGALTGGFVLVGIHNLTGGFDAVGYIGGYLLIASAALAYYAGAALVVNSTWKRTLLPLFGRA